MVAANVLSTLAQAGAIFIDATRHLEKRPLLVL